MVNLTLISTGMPYGFVRIFLFIFFFFLFFRRQGFRMITFDRQAGPLQNFNRSHVMAIGRSVSFSDPGATPGWGRGAPQTPQTKILVRKFFAPPPNLFFYFLFFWAFLRPQEHFLAEIFFSVKNSTPPPHLHAPRPVLRTLTPILVQ